MRPIIERFRQIAVKWLQSLYELLCFGAVLMLAGALMVPPSLILTWILYFAGASLAGLLLGQFLSRSRVWLKLLLSLATAGAAAYQLFGITPYMPITSLLGAFLLYRAIDLAHTAWEDHFPLPLSWFGLLLYLVTSLLFARWERVSAYHTAVSLMGLSFLILMLFALNHRAMRIASHASGARVVLPRRMLKQNRWMMGILSAAVLLIGFFERLRDTVGRIAVQVLRQIAQWLASVPLGMQGLTPGGREQILILPEASPANPFWQKVLDILLYIIGGAVVLALAGIILIILWLGLRSLFLGLIHLLGQRSEGSGEGYIDIRESLWDMKSALGSLRRIGARLRRGFGSRDRWAGLADNRERMRYLYRRYVRRAMAAGFTPDTVATASETVLSAQRYIKDDSLAPQLLSGYQAARYGDAMPSDGEIAAIREALDRL